MTQTPKVLISYAWTDRRHDAKVEALAARLRRGGIDAELDRWDLRAGQDVNTFMERMVADPMVTKVLVICNAKYRDRANARLGGVGAESTLISDRVYRDPRQTKFIPVVFEYQNNEACIPVFLSGKKYIDLSTPELLQQNWTELLDAVLNRPPSNKPPMGTPPGKVRASTRSLRGDAPSPRPAAPTRVSSGVHLPARLTLRVPRSTARQQLTALLTALQPLLARRSPRNLQGATPEVAGIKREVQRWGQRVRAVLTACFEEPAEELLRVTRLRFTTLKEVQAQLRARAEGLEALSKRVEGLRKQPSPSKQEPSVRRLPATSPKSTGKKAVSPPRAGGTVSDSGDWVLLGEGYYRTVSVLEPDTDTIQVRIRPRSGAEETQVRDLGQAGGFAGPRLRFAHRNEATWASVSGVQPSTRAGKPELLVTLRRDPSGMRDALFYGQEVADIAERRARWVLLGDTPNPQTKYRLSFYDQAVETQLDTGLLGSLWRSWDGTPSEFLRAARLLAVFYLKTLGVVDVIHDLQLGLFKGKALQVTLQAEKRGSLRGGSHPVAVSDVCLLPDKGSIPTSG